MQEQRQFEGMSLSDVEALDRPRRALALASAGRTPVVAEEFRTVARDSFGSAFKRWAMVRSNAKGKQRLTRSSVMGYAMLWRVFLDWLDKAAPERTIERLDYPLVRAFALSRNIGKHDPVNVDPSRSRYVWRLLRLIEQVVEEHTRAHHLPRNDCVATAVDRLGLRLANADEFAARPQVCSNAESAAIIEYVSGSRPRAGRAARASAVTSWMEVRDCAAVAVHLGAGLTPAEVRRLRVQDVAGRLARRGAQTISEPWRITVQAAAACPEHDTPIASWASQVLGHWLQVRETVSLPGRLAFPGDARGGAWTKDDHYDGVRRVLRAAGLGDEALAGGSFRLRHTFAKRQLRRHHPREEVARWLGIKNPERLAVYEQRMDEPVANVA